MLPGGYRLPQDVLKQTKLLFLVPIPQPPPQTFADLGGGLGQLCQVALHPSIHCVGTRRTAEKAERGGGRGLQICMYANLKESDRLGNFFSLLKCGTALSTVISPTKLFVGIDRRQR